MSQGADAMVSLAPQERSIPEAARAQRQIRALLEQERLCHPDPSYVASVYAKRFSVHFREKVVKYINEVSSSPRAGMSCLMHSLPPV